MQKRVKLQMIVRQNISFKQNLRLRQVALNCVFKNLIFSTLYTFRSTFFNERSPPFYLLRTAEENDFFLMIPEITIRRADSL